jgi:hypothetical protein
MTINRPEEAEAAALGKTTGIYGIYRKRASPAGGASVHPGAG